MKIKIFILQFKCYYSKANHAVNKRCEYGVHVTNSYIHAKFNLKEFCLIFTEIFIIIFINIIYYS